MAVAIVVNAVNTTDNINILLIVIRIRDQVIYVRRSTILLVLATS